MTEPRKLACGGCGRFREWEPFDPALDCRLCWLGRNDERYRKLYAGLEIISPQKQESKEPVGDELAKLFSWLSAVPSGSCGCKKLQSAMNRGVAWCRENYQLILAKLEKEAFARNIPMPRQAFIPFLELAIWRASLAEHENQF